MSENDRTAAAIKGQLSKFSGIIAKGLSKAKQRLIKEMVYGIQAGKDIKLSNISRASRPKTAYPEIWMMKILRKRSTRRSAGWGARR